VVTENELEEKSEPRSFRLPSEVYEWLRREAFDGRTSMNAVVVAAVREAMAAKDAAQ
jgi:hypothetical protein